jgi:replicative DNA helicase
MTEIPKAYPHALGVEKSVLSILLQYPETLSDAPMLISEHFHMPGHRVIFELIQELAAAGKTTELVSFVQTLLDRGKLDSVGGPAAVSDIYTHQPSTGSFQAHISILTEKLARRMTIAAAHEMERVAYEGEDPAEILEATSAPISAVHDMLTATRPARSTKAVLSACIERFRLLCTGAADPMGIETSLVEINRRFRGLHESQTIVVSAYPGGGKTTLAGQLAADAAMAGRNTMVCSLEMPAADFMNRMLAYVARCPLDALTEPLEYAMNRYGAQGPTKDMLRAIEGASTKIKDSPLFIEDMAGVNVHQVVACIRRAHRKSHLKVVIVDFIQRLAATPEMRRESREQQLSHAANHLADVAKELGFCLILCSQLNKEGAAKGAEAINEAADLHLQIIQDRTGPAPTFVHVGIAVLKDRHHGHDGEMLPIILEGPMVRFIPKPLKP